MSKRVPASMRTCESLRRLIESETAAADGREDPVKLALVMRRPARLPL